MPTKKHGVTWKAPPHSIAKVKILEDYLVTWFQILGRTRRNQDLLYVDGFAGPGEYSNYPKGSPVAALSAAQDAVTRTGGAWVAGDIHCAFIEADVARYAHLRQVIGSLVLPARIHVHTKRASFQDGLRELRTEMPRAFSGTHPLFVFIDPFGATGAPFGTVSEILRSPCSEVLINLDADGIGRIFRAGSAADAERILDQVFGDRSWSSVLSGQVPVTVLYQQVLTLYKERLRALPNVRYVFTFEMRKTERELSYYLVFASQHPLGLVKMKEAMKRIGHVGDYRFTDARVDQPSLLRFDDPTPYARQLWGAFRGRSASYGELHDYALNETPFVNPKAMLKHLEDEGLIRVESSDPNRRWGFNERTLRAVHFLDGDPHG